MKKNRFLISQIEMLLEMKNEHMYLEAYECALSWKESHPHIIEFDNLVQVLKPLIYFDVEDKVLLKYNGTSQTVEVPDGIEKIGNGCFESNHSIVNVTLPKSVTRIDVKAFFDCSNLKSIHLPKNLKSIGKGAFLKCTSLEGIILPDSIKTINDYTFYQCVNLTKVKLPKQLKKIGKYAFAECNSLKEIDLNVNTVRAFNSFEDNLTFKTHN